MTLVDSTSPFEEWWQENRQLELRGYPRKEAAKRAWNVQEIKFKEQRQSIEELEAVQKEKIMRIGTLEIQLMDIEAAWLELVGNTAEKDDFGNVLIAEVDYEAFHKLATQDT